MNERDMSLLKAVSEAVKEQLAAVHKKYETAFQAQSNKIAELEEKLRNARLILSMNGPSSNLYLKRLMCRRHQSCLILARW